MKNTDDKAKLWGGRFQGSVHPVVASFNASFSFDRALLSQDLEASSAWSKALERAGVLTKAEGDSIRKGLAQIGQEAAVLLAVDASSEDVHSFIEANLVAKIGDAAKKLHIGRSRNDQVATAFRLWVRNECDAVMGLLRGVRRALTALALKNPEGAMPGYTHLQKAQPVLFAHWCLAYSEMLKRDEARFQSARQSANVMPLGSGALAGTSQPVDREALALDLGFAAVTRNSLDAVSDRDFAVEFLAAASLTMVHLSRLAEDVILYASHEFGFFELPDSVSTGSSLMPQKKNPDPMELVRGKTGRVVGDLMGLLTVLKGLPLAYNKDLQEDKEGVFDAARNLKICLEATAVTVERLIPRPERMHQAAGTGYMNATELADLLATKGMPFRNAHEAAGKIVLEALGKGVELHELPLEAFRAHCPQLGPEVFAALSVAQTLASKNAIGGTSPARVKEELHRTLRELETPATKAP